MRTQSPVVLAITCLFLAGLLRQAQADGCPSNSEPYRSDEASEETVVHCRCVAGYSFSAGACVAVTGQSPTPSSSRNDFGTANVQPKRDGGNPVPIVHAPVLKKPEPTLESSNDLQRQEDEARQELYWLHYHLFVIATASRSNKPEDMPVDWELDEAREHLSRYIELVRNIESVTHTAQIAQERYQQRVRNMEVAREKGSYYVRQSQGTVTTDAMPSTTDFAPWTADDLIRNGRKCTFDATVLHCD